MIRRLGETGEPGEVDVTVRRHEERAHDLRVVAREGIRWVYPGRRGARAAGAGATRARGTRGRTTLAAAARARSTRGRTTLAAAA